MTTFIHKISPKMTLPNSGALVYCLWSIYTATFIWNRCIALFEGKWGQFDRAKPTFKMLLASWNFYTVEKKIRFFIAKNLESVGQRAAKLPAFKLWEWFNPGPTRTQAERFEWGLGQTADFFLRPLTLTAGKFEALLIYRSYIYSI